MKISKFFSHLYCFPKMWSLLRESLCLVTWHFVAFQFNWWRHPMLPNMHFLYFLKFYFSLNRRWPWSEFESIQIGARFSESRSVGVSPNTHRPHFHSHISVQKYREKKINQKYRTSGYLSDNAGNMPDKSKIRTKNCQLPKKWQKFDDLLLIPAGVEISDILEDLAEKYQGMVIGIYWQAR